MVHLNNCKQNSNFQWQNPGTAQQPLNESQILRARLNQRAALQQQQGTGDNTTLKTLLHQPPQGIQQQQQQQIRLIFVRLSKMPVSLCMYIQLLLYRNFLYVDLKLIIFNNLFTNDDF